MTSTENSLNNLTVEISSRGGGQQIVLNDISPSTTIGQLKTQLNVAENARFGRQDKYENWDNRRPLSDYFVKSDEIFTCVIQCVRENGQSKFDDYEEWLAENKTK